MKYSIICLFFLIIISCKESNPQSDNNVDGLAEKELTQVDDGFYGEKFDISEVKNHKSVFEAYQNLKPGDTLEMRFESKVNSVCKEKGCWMRLELPENQETLVTFKDYGFFVPKDIENQTAIVHGKAFVKETSVEELKHFAEDAGKSEEEIAAITESNLTYSFEADGVYLK